MTPQWIVELFHRNCTGPVDKTSQRKMFNHTEHSNIWWARNQVFWDCCTPVSTCQTVDPYVTSLLLSRELSTEIECRRLFNQRKITETPFTIRKVKDIWFKSHTLLFTKNNPFVVSCLFVLLLLFHLLWFWRNDEKMDITIMDHNPNYCYLEIKKKEKNIYSFYTSVQLI